MAIHNILALTVIISLGGYNLIQAETIRGEDIPTLNITRMAGKWHLVSTYKENQQIKCSTSIVSPQSDNSYTLNVTYSFTSEATNNNSKLPHEPVRAFFTANMEKDSSVIKTKDKDDHEIFWLMFDVDYDSHLAIYGTTTTGEISDGTKGVVFIVSRQPTISEEKIAKIKQSKFYQHGVDPGLTLISLDATGCEL